MKVKKYWQRAAMEGHVIARYNLGVMEMNESPWRAYTHFTIAAKGGHDESLKKTKQIRVLLPKMNSLRHYELIKRQ